MEPAEQIFVATAANSVAQEHYQNSVARPLTDAIVGLIPPSLRESARASNGAYYAWGAMSGPRNDGTFNALRIGDYVLFVFGRRYRAWARVTAKMEDAEFARALWGSESGKTWQNVYFLGEPVYIDVQLESLETHLQRLYLGFTRISKPNIERILADFGSIENFISESFSPSSYLIVRSNEDSPWNDEDGLGYEYGTNVANWKRVQPGSKVLIERGVDGFRLLLGAAVVSAIDDRGDQKGQRILYARFRDYIGFVSPLVYPPEQRAEIEALPNFNLQHSITYITAQIYTEILAALRQSEQAELAKEELKDERGGNDAPTRRSISKDPPRAARGGRHSSDPEVRRQLLDRRNKSHHALVVAFKDAAESAGASCDCTQFADLLLEGPSFNAIIEVKSVNNDFLKQARIGVGQLHVYHFLHLTFNGFGTDDDVRLYLLFDAIPNPGLVRFLRRKGVGTIWLVENVFYADPTTLGEMLWLKAF